jgi:hypothetical protein
MSENATPISDPTTVINALSARVRELESALAQQQTRQREDMPAQIEALFRWMRARSVIPLYVGSVPVEKARAEFVGTIGDPLLLTNTVAERVLGQVWFLNDAPMPEEAKDALRQASQYGMSRW